MINHAEKFGLADLHQLRGRVGRGSHQAYAYLLIPGDLTLSRDAMRRLRAIQEMSELGSGFKLAIQDLEIRGAGNLLGASQSGHIAAVGFEFYTQIDGKGRPGAEGRRDGRRDHSGDPLSDSGLYPGGLCRRSRRTVESLSKTFLFPVE